MALNAARDSVRTILREMYVKKWRERPECCEVLDKYDKWSIHENILLNDYKFVTNVYNKR